MLKYAKLVNEKTKEVNVGLGDDTEFYESIGMLLMDVEQAWNGGWYIKGYAPEEPAPTHEEQREKRAEAYRQEKDPITCQIQSLRDEEQTPEVIAEINMLLQERQLVVENIHNRYPYPDEETIEESE